MADPFLWAGIDAGAIFDRVNGISRSRLPVAANIAFATASPIGAVAGSPMPPVFRCWRRA